MPTPVDYEVGKGLAQRNVCAQCSGRLSVAWGGFWGYDGYVLRCGTDPIHQGIKPKSNTRKLYDLDTKTLKEFDVTTQREIVPLPKTEQGMLQRFREAEAIGLWPDAMTEKQAAVLAHVALAYGLDPFMGEIMPYQGRPYVTMNGRRRKDEEAGHYASVRFRPLRSEEKELYTEADALKDDDIAIICVLTTERGQAIEGFGRVLGTERKGNAYLPLVKRPIEMAQKRAERRAREIAYGPIALPQGFTPAVRVYQEGDVVEGEAREIDTATGEIRPARLSETEEIFSPDAGADAPPVPEAFHAVVNRGGQHGLDLTAFCERVLPAKCHTIQEFIRIGGTPETAEKRLDEYLKKAGV